MNAFVSECRTKFSPAQANAVYFQDQFEEADTLTVVLLILDTIFGVLIIITMILCLFSLCSSMSANLLDQTKEIGILRAMGFTQSRITMLYLYEAFVLVLASSLLGVMIGVIVAFTMTLQRVVFTGIPIFFFFPWTQFCIIMVMSFFCAFISSYGPAKQLVRQDIATIFRQGA